MRVVLDAGARTVKNTQRHIIFVEILPSTHLSAESPRENGCEEINVKGEFVDAA